MKFKFPRSNRISRSWEYDLVFRTGSRINGKLVRLLVVNTGNDDATRIGVVVGKRQGNACFRNLHRRKMKEAARRMLPFLKQGFLVVLSIRKAGYFANWEDIYMDLSEVAGRAGILHGGPEPGRLIGQDR